MKVFIPRFTSVMSLFSEYFLLEQFVSTETCEEVTWRMLAVPDSVSAGAKTVRCVCLSCLCAQTLV